MPTVPSKGIPGTYPELLPWRADELLSEEDGQIENKCSSFVMEGKKVPLELTFAWEDRMEVASEKDSQINKQVSAAAEGGGQNVHPLKFIAEALLYSPSAGL